VNNADYQISPPSPLSMKRVVNDAFIRHLSLLQNALLAQPLRYAKKFYPRNIKYIPAVKFFSCLDFERKSSFCKRLICIENPDDVSPSSKELTMYH